MLVHKRILVRLLLFVILSICHTVIKIHVRNKYECSSASSWQTLSVSYCMEDIHTDVNILQYSGKRRIMKLKFRISNGSLVSWAQTDRLITEIIAL